MKHRQMAGIGFASLLLAGVVGCASYRPLTIEPVAAKSTPILPAFDEGTYSYDRDGTLTFILESYTQDPKTHQRIDQIATFRVFWRPVGGRTTMEKSALNATYRYILMTPTSVGMYEGAGFVRLWGKNGKSHIGARVMDGDLRLTESSANFVDTIGRCRIRGNIKLRYDDARTVDRLLAAQQAFFARSMQKPKTAGAPGKTTQPATFPTADPNSIRMMLPPTTEPTTQPTTQPSTKPTSAP